MPSRIPVAFDKREQLVLLNGARIGKGAIVGAATVVDFEVPPFTVVVGNPARVVSQGRSKN